MVQTRTTAKHILMRSRLGFGLRGSLRSNFSTLTASTSECEGSGPQALPDSCSPPADLTRPPRAGFLLFRLEAAGPAHPHVRCMRPRRLSSIHEVPDARQVRSLPCDHGQNWPRPCRSSSDLCSLSREAEARLADLQFGAPSHLDSVGSEPSVGSVTINVCLRIVRPSHGINGQRYRGVARPHVSDDRVRIKDIYRRV